MSRLKQRNEPVINNLISSPVVLLLEVANRDETGAAPYSKLVFFGRPLNTAGRAIDPEDDQGGLPHVTLQGPDVGVPVGATSHDAVALRGPVDTCNRQYYSNAISI